MNRWIIKKTSEIFANSIFSLKNCLCFHPDKNVSHSFFVLETLDWVNVVALTPEKKFLLVRQHRLGTNQVTLETVGGIIERDLSPEEAARSELLEETGFLPENLVLMKKFSVNPSIQNNSIYFFFASGCTRVGEQKLDPAEDIEVVEFTPEEIRAMMDNGTISHAIVHQALSLFFESKHG